MHPTSRFILDTVRKDLYDMPKLSNSLITHSTQNAHNVSIYRVYDNYEAIFADDMNYDTLLSIRTDMIQNSIDVENLVLEYTRNIQVEFCGSDSNPIFCIIKYKRCVFTNPNNLPIRELHCEDCYY